MKHDFKITMILLAMFFVTQMIGLAVINAYSPKVVQVEKDGVVVNETVATEVPFGMEPPEIEPEFSWSIIPSIFIAILIATLLFLILSRLGIAFLIKAWFFFVVMITSAISLTALISMTNPAWDKVLTMSLGYPLTLVSVIALALALVLTFFKIVRRNFLIHNLTELLIYPGLAAVFVPLIYQIKVPVVLKLEPSIFWCMILLLAIALYDMYAVWKSKHMIELAKYQINQLKIFPGFFLPYLSNKSAEQMKKLRKIKNIKLEDVKKKTRKIKVSLAVLGGGDIAFPLIFAGIVMRTSSFLNALIVAICVTISLLLMSAIAKKESFYPAMPFLSAGCIIGYLITLLI